MRLFPRIKNIKSIYTAKIKIRNAKNLIKNLLHLLLNGSDLQKLFIFLKNFFKKINIEINRNDFYKSKRFDHGDWFTHKVPLFMNYFQNKNEINEILEVGSWEGRSACFFLNYFKNCNITCVDTWKGSPENFNNTKTNLSIVEKNFDYNILEYKSRVTKIKSTSKNFFSNNIKKFDLIYIDGSHIYEDVLNDANESFKILKDKSYILFDDYDWVFHKKGKNPINAINQFLKSNRDKIQTIYISSQVLVKKIK